jgi:hypothetical protein
MPQHDDRTVHDHISLIRAVRPDWLSIEDGQQRLNSATFKDGSLEASCFISEEVGGLEGFKRDILPRLEEEWGFRPTHVATITTGAVRAAELWIYRKPEEFHNNPAHVVICPSNEMSKSKYGRKAGGLKDAAQLLNIADEQEPNQTAE